MTISANGGDIILVNAKPSGQECGRIHIKRGKHHNQGKLKHDKGIFSFSFPYVLWQKGFKSNTIFQKLVIL